jgi:hypothetical protein
MSEILHTGNIIDIATAEPNPFADPAPDVNDWIFTFGYGQRLIPEPTFPEDPKVEGFPLANRFVRISGTHNDARTEMIRRFGRTWSFQYADDNDAAHMIRRYGLRELT